MANPDNTGKRMPTILRKGLYRNTLEDQDGKEVGRIGNVFAVTAQDETEEAAFIEALRDEIALRYDCYPDLLAALKRSVHLLAEIHAGSVPSRGVVGNALDRGVDLIKMLDPAYYGGPSAKKGLTK